MRWGLLVGEGALSRPVVCWGMHAEESRSLGPGKGASSCLISQAGSWAELCWLPITCDRWPLAPPGGPEQGQASRPSRNSSKPREVRDLGRGVEVPQTGGRCLGSDPSSAQAGFSRPLGPCSLLLRGGRHPCHLLGADVISLCWWRRGLGRGEEILRELWMGGSRQRSLSQETGRFLSSPPPRS